MEIGQSAATELSDRLAKDLTALGFNVEKQAGEAPTSSDSLLFEGRFLDVDEGAATPRVIIGFGAGKSYLATRVKVYRIAGGKAYLGCVSYPADQTADQLNAYLTHYFAQQGWIDPEKARAEKVNLMPKR